MPNSFGSVVHAPKYGEQLAVADEGIGVQLYCDCMQIYPPGLVWWRYDEYIPLSMEEYNELKGKHKCPK